MKQLKAERLISWILLRSALTNWLNKHVIHPAQIRYWMIRAVTMQLMGRYHYLRDAPSHVIVDFMSLGPDLPEVEDQQARAVMERISMVAFAENQLRHQVLIRKMRQSVRWLVNNFPEKAGTPEVLKMEEEITVAEQELDRRSRHIHRVK